MIRFVPPDSSDRRGALEGIVDAAVADGKSNPPWIAVEDETGRWIHHVAAMPPGERASGVVALSSEKALLDAVRLGIGGGMWLPPSAAGASAALDAAATHGGPYVTPDAWLADLASPVDQKMVAVTWVNRPFWRCQLGEPVMATQLAALAGQLGVLPALLPWPALLLSPRPTAEIHAAWDRVVGEAGISSEGIEVIACDPREGHCGVVTTAMRSLASHVSEDKDPKESGFPKPVYQLPTGRLVGRWAPGEIDGYTIDDGFWFATPHSVSTAGFRWRLESSDASRWVDDVLQIETGNNAVRVPGWVAHEAGPGRPAGLLIERLAAAAERSGVALWIPNADGSRLRFLLRLPGEIWVDGPAVPALG